MKLYFESILDPSSDFLISAKEGNFPQNFFSLRKPCNKNQDSRFVTHGRGDSTAAYMFVCERQCAFALKKLLSD